MDTSTNFNCANVYQIEQRKYCQVVKFQNLCGFQVRVAADGKSRGAKKGDEKESLGHGHSPNAHHHLSHAPWQGRPGAQQGIFRGDRGREEEERRRMGFASRIRPSRLTLVVGFQQSRRYDGEAISSGWETLVAGGEAEEEQAFARPGLATRDHPMSSSP